ncbi:hypothetical protein DERF_001658 [Dermatophagoides farinae]|uniref:Uncharacterized protein n=1 Tax=Dermatophagoides farinae TaxID=6954 RepID=A0A922L8V3_DERFA|nr:hypothetical protein DERF_001658 [Dermatophagoides farinae]
MYILFRFGHDHGSGTNSKDRLHIYIYRPASKLFVKHIGINPIILSTASNYNLLMSFYLNQMKTDAII